MSRGKYLSLEEARKANQLKQFAKEHPSKGDKTQFDKVFKRMAKADRAKTAKREHSAP